MRCEHSAHTAHVRSVADHGAGHREATLRRRYKASALAVVSLLVFSHLPLTRAASTERALVGGNSAFGLALYRELSSAEGNLFFSPYSLSIAFAMAYAGAAGTTERQMAATMRFSLSQERLHRAFADLQGKLEKAQKQGDVELRLASSLWPDKEYPLREAFLDRVETEYKTEITAVDYAEETEKARQSINRWVEERTEDKIKQLVGPGVLDESTRLVLANAVYFKGAWRSPFDERRTQHLPFKLSPQATVRAPMMYQQGRFGYWANEELQVLEMPYAGDRLSMLVLLPTAVDGLPRLEKQLTLENLRDWTRQLHEQEVDVWMPRFALESAFRLDKTLQQMGMVDAFTNAADFSGIDGTRSLYISAALHKAYVDVNEEGTEAAAATALGLSLTSARIMPNPKFRADHAFVFLIRERTTETILFAGRLANPTRGPS